MRIGSLQLEKKQTVPLYKKILNPIICVLLGLAFSAIFIIISGFDPLTVFAKMISYSFLNSMGLYGSINGALPLMFCGLSVALAFRMKLNNIGAEGQFAIGAVLGGWFALYGPSLPAPFGLIVMFLLCALGGGLWAAIAAALKAYWKINETIVTLMFNYIALLFLDYLCYGPWMAPKQTTAITPLIPDSMYLPGLGGTSSALILAVVIALLLQFYLQRTTGGYQISVIRDSSQSATYAGISVKRFIFIVFILSGALAGLAGFVKVTGILHRVQAQLPGGAGYTGIVVAYLSQFNPLVVILVAILFGGLQNSCAAVQIMGVPSQIATMIQGTIMIFVIAGEFLNHYKISFYREDGMEVPEQ
ncbi:MAG: hypothetical protein H6Q64_609 [Firmicutes bacterium]|nr:hypothetical protein [Bacillota bacterium]